MKQYIDCIKHILENGQDVSDRTGTGTRSVFGYQMRFNLREGFPAVTTKKLAWKAVVGELLWFLEGSTDERRLAELTHGKDRTELTDKSTIWTANANEQGVALGYANNKFYKGLGPVYGGQWRDWNGYDQLANLITDIKTNPDSRRHILSAWNVAELPEMALPPCHVMAQFRVYGNELSCQVYQRSVDTGLGLPFNIASYALLTHIIARECGLDVGDLVHTSGDAHVYSDHIEPLTEMIKREPYPLPTLKIDDSFKLLDGLAFGFLNEDASLFTLENYQYHPTIKMKMAV